MSLITRMRKQKATWWAQGARDASGRVTYLDPVTIKCRWDDMKKEIILSNGTKYITKSILYPDKILKLEDYVIVGEIDESTDEDFNRNPRNFPGAAEVVGVDRIPNLKATEYLNIAYT